MGSLAMYQDSFQRLRSWDELSQKERRNTSVYRLVYSNKSDTAFKNSTFSFRSVSSKQNVARFFRFYVYIVAIKGHEEEIY